MSRISIEVTPQQHRRLKAVAALSGQSIKDYILSQSIPGEHIESGNTLQPLESFLEQRISQAASGGISGRSVSEIWADVQSKKA
ncbi:MAG: antitoxin [Verrucomicrobiota bacterium]